MIEVDGSIIIRIFNNPKTKRLEPESAHLSMIHVFEFDITTIYQPS